MNNKFLWFPEVTNLDAGSCILSHPTDFLSSSSKHHRPVTCILSWSKNLEVTKWMFLTSPQCSNPIGIGFRCREAFKHPKSHNFDKKKRDTQFTHNPKKTQTQECQQIVNLTYLASLVYPAGHLSSNPILGNCKSTISTCIFHSATSSQIVTTGNLSRCFCCTCAQCSEQYCKKKKNRKKKWRVDILTGATKGILTRIGVGLRIG